MYIDENTVCSLGSLRGLLSTNSNLYESRNISDIHRHMSEDFCDHILRAPGQQSLGLRQVWDKWAGILISLQRYFVHDGGVQLVVPSFGDGLLLHLALQGRATIKTKDELFTLAPGTGCIFFQGCSADHHFSSDYEHLAIRVPIEGNIDCGHEAHYISNRGTQGIISFLELIKENYQINNRPINKEYLRNIFMALIANRDVRFLNESVNCYAPKESAPRCVKIAERYIKLNYGTPIALDDIAKTCGVSVRTLQSCFKNFRKLSISTYIRMIRLEAARELLQSSLNKKSISDVACQCGFNHLGRFSRYYKERFGELPSSVIRAEISCQI